MVNGTVDPPAGTPNECPKHFQIRGQIRASGAVAASRSYNYHYDCYPTIYGGIHVDLQPCNQLTKFTVYLDLPAGPHTQDIEFDFSDGTGYTRTFTLSAGEPTSVGVFHRLIINSPLHLTATLVNYPFTATVTSADVKCSLS